MRMNRAEFPVESPKNDTSAGESLPPSGPALQVIVLVPALEESEKETSPPAPVAAITAPILMMVAFPALEESRKAQSPPALNWPGVLVIVASAAVDVPEKRV